MTWKYGDPERRKDNWTLITTEQRKRIGKRFRDRSDGTEYVFYGIVDGYDDYYYGMCAKGELRLLSCVGSIENHGFEEIPSNSLEDEERERYERRRIK